MQLGFVIDHARCIGCHACTVACKSENQVQVGSFRTWVKYVESGTFPAVRRSFAVLRCNQCSNAPCVAICPTGALVKRPDGIVDVDHRSCIGCKGCMQACPYDALYIDDASGTAEKCHFCAHRTELGLAPACAVVCPTEAIIPGDFDDPSSRVSLLKASGRLSARKPEAGTVPNVYYREVDPAGIEPLRTSGAGGYLWAEQPSGPMQAAAVSADAHHRAEARTVYDVAHAPLWGAKITAYLFTKSLAAGIFLAAVVAGLGLDSGLAVPQRMAPAIPLAALACLLLTTLLLVGDLKRPDRFYYIVTRGRSSSWIVRGTFVLAAYGAGLAAWLALGLRNHQLAGGPAMLLLAVTALAGLLTASYTAWLFGQAKGRALWLKRGLAAHLVVQALVAGFAALLCHELAFGSAGAARLTALRTGLGASLALHALVLLTERWLAPARRKAEYLRAIELITHGLFARRYYAVCLALGVVVPCLLLALGGPPWALAAAALLALAGLYVYEDIFVRAGQLVPIS